MTLDEYRRQKGWSYAHLARLLGASHATMARRWCLDFDVTDKTIPNQEYMDRIVRISLGEVMPNDFYIRRD